MKKSYAVLGILSAVITIATVRSAGPLAAQAPSRELAPLQLIQRIPVPNVSGRIDHFTADPKRRLLIFAALGNHTVEIVNTLEGKVVHGGLGTRTKMELWCSGLT